MASEAERGGMGLLRALAPKAAGVRQLASRLIEATEPLIRATACGYRSTLLRNTRLTRKQDCDAEKQA